MLASPLNGARSQTAARLYQDDSKCQASILSHFSSTICPLADSMNFLTNALGSKPASSKSITSESEPIGGTQKTSSARRTSSETNDVDSDTLRGSGSRSVTSCAGPRTKTSFQLRYPPPTTKQKQRLNIRPKLLLQLHRTSQTSRPKPTFDVLPSVVFAPRLARKFPNTFKARGGLGVDDLVVVNSEDYSATVEEEDHSDDLLDNDKWKSRDIIAAICQLNSSSSTADRRAEICFSRRGTWVASSLAKGGYEFVYTDSQGEKKVARWIPRRKSLRKSKPSPSTLDSPAFNFSLLEPTSRRHAVIATMDAQSIDVCDAYSRPTGDPSRSSASSFDSTAAIEVTESLRTLIIVSGIWVAWCEGFLPQSGRKQPASPCPDSPREAFGMAGHSRRSVSLTLSNQERNQVLEETLKVPPRPKPHQIESAGSLETAPSASNLSLVPRRSKSVSSTMFIRRSSGRQDAIWEDTTTLAESDTTTDDKQNSTPEDNRDSFLGKTTTTGTKEIRKSPPSSLLEKEKEKTRKLRVLSKIFGPHKS